MAIDEIRKYCLAFPEATENLQWADDLCFKVRGKIFAIVTLTGIPMKTCFKCTPDTFAELIEREGIGPAPYVGRYKWVLVEGPAALRDRELKDLIRQSYEMVVAKAPKARKRIPKPQKPAGAKRSRKKRPK